MIIRGWHIEGFGHFADVEMDGLGPGVNLFVGPNEAGKSTLLSFLRSMLFGLPDKRNTEYIGPLKSSSYGGTLFVENASGLWSVGRRGRSAEITRPDGTRGGQEDLDRLTGGADKAIFRSVFSFDLSDLAGLEGSAEKVKERLFFAAIQGGGVSGAQTLADFSKEAETLFKSGGSKNRIAKLVGEINDEADKKRKGLELAKDFAELAKSEEFWRERIDDLKLEVDRTRKLDGEAVLLIELWGTENDKRETASELTSLGDVAGFPKNGLEKFKELAGRRDLLEEQLRKTVAERDEAQSELGDPALAQKIRVAAPTIKELVDQRSGVDQLRDQLNETREKLAGADRDLDRRLGELGPGWSRERMATLDLGLVRLGEIRTFQRELGEAADEVRRLRHRVDETGEELAHLKDENVTGEELDSLGYRKKLVRDLRKLIGDRKVAEAQLKGSMGAGANDWAQKGFDRWSAPALVLLGITGVGLGLFLEAPHSSYAITAGIGLLVLGGGLFQRRRSEPDTSKNVALYKSALAECDRVAERIAEDAFELGLKAEVDHDALDSVEDELERLGKVAAKKKRAEEAERVLALRRAQLEEAQKVQLELAAKWRELLGVWALGESADLSPGDALDLITALKQTLSGCEEAANLSSRIDSLSSRVAQWEQLIRKTASTAGLDENVTVGRLAEEAERVTRIDLEIKRLDEEEGALRRKLDIVLEKVGGLFTSTGCDNEDYFVELGERAARHNALTEKLARLTRLVDERLGLGKEADRLREELGSGRVLEWEEQREQCGEELARLEVEHDEAVKAHANAERDIKDAVESAELPEIETRMEGLRADLEETARRWRVLTLASALLKGSLENFTRDRQPNVYRHASALFAEITGSRYTNVAQTVGKQEIEVIDVEGKRKSVDQLSRGTREELYLALRLGLAAEFGERAAPLPIIGDDVLVNFDPERGKAAAGMLARFSKEHQLLFFTCHPHTVDWFRETDPNTKVFTIDLV